jgi:tetratricopeptide (TPR) repeat protein
MAAGIPVNRSIAWIALIPQLLIVLLIIYIFSLLNLGEPTLLGGLTYLVISYVLRTYVVIDFRKGMQLCKTHKFKEAIPHFEKSISFFKEKKWLDKYRYVLLLSSSKMTYREMSLCNIAFCYSQTGEPQQAKLYYENILREFPGNAIATAALRMIRSFESPVSTAQIHQI